MVVVSGGRQAAPKPDYRALVDKLAADRLAAEAMERCMEIVAVATDRQGVAALSKGLMLEELG